MSKDSIQQRMAAWMADYEDPTGAFRAVPDRDTLLGTAFDIMKECYPKFVTVENYRAALMLLIGD